MPAPADDVNFSQYPGFAEYFAANPPADTLPSAEDQALLTRHRPRLYISDAAETNPPIRFYEDYIGQGRLLARDGSVIGDAVTAAQLNDHREDPHVVFEHVPTDTQTAPVMYGRVDRKVFDLGGRDRRFTFLTWSAVFRVSGIAAGISAIKGFALGLAGDLHDWHQLDHYTAVTLALDESGKPVAAMFQAQLPADDAVRRRYRFSGRRPDRRRRGTAIERILSAPAGPLGPPCRQFHVAGAGAVSDHG